jgi:hypothetical protein
MAMLRALIFGFAALLLLAGCSSTPNGNVLVDEEAYRGQLAAAVTPVGLGAGPAIPAAERARIQSQLISSLDAAGMFASVIPLSSPNQSNEAELIIDASVVDGSYGGAGLERVTLRVRARRKSTGEVGIDDKYKGRASRKSSAAQGAIDDLIRDLRRKYKEKPVY